MFIRCKNRALCIRDCVTLGLSDEPLKADGPLYLVFMPGEVKYPTSLEMCNLSWTPHSSLEDNYVNHSCVNPKMGCLQYT